MSDEFFEYIKSSELYKDMSDVLDYLLTNVCAEIKVGSHEYMMGFKQLQEYVLDFFYYAVIRYPVCNPDEKDLIKNELIDYAEEYKQRVILWMYAESVGFEEFVSQFTGNEVRIGGVERSFTSTDARETDVDPYIDRKLKNFDEMYGAGVKDVSMFLNHHVWSKVYSEFYHVYPLREQVGFDRTQFNVTIKSFDPDKFNAAKDRYRSQDYSTLPRIVVDYTDKNDEDDVPLRLPLEDHNIKKIEVTLSHYVSFVFKKNNAPLLKGIKMNDIYLLKMTVVPEPEHKILGNMLNLSYDEMCDAVKRALAELYELTGILIEFQSVLLNDVELNLTFLQDCKFNHLMRSVSYFAQYARKGYDLHEYRARDTETVQYDRVTEGSRKKSITKKLSKMKVTGITAEANTIIVRLYDKKEETIRYALKQGYDLKFEDEDKAIVRLEFEIRNKDQLRHYFGTYGNDAPQLCSLSQEIIEKTYTDLVNKFFVKTYEKGYLPQSMTELKNIVRTLDTSTKGGKWKTDLQKAVLSQEIWVKSTPALLSEKDILEVMEENRTFKRHPKRYQKILIELLEEPSTYKRGQDRAYTMLVNFLVKTYGLESLSDKRRIGYIYNLDKLPDRKEEEEVEKTNIALQLNMENTDWNKI